MTAVTAGRTPLADLIGVIARALEPGDYEHDTDWIDGHPVTVPTPPAHLVNLDIMAAVLPEPDNDGTIDATEAGNSILSVITERLSGDYILRLHSLVRRLTEQAELYEQENGLTGTGIPGPDDPAPGYSPKCQHCGGPVKAARGPKARYCSNSHKVMASRARKREREHVNATATAAR